MTWRRKLTAAFGLLTVAAVILVGAPAHAAGVPVTERIGGKDRYATAIAVTHAAFPDTAKVVYLASGENFPDALSAGSVAVHTNGAVLITQAKTLRADVRAEIRRLAPDRIVVVGGTRAVSDAVLNTVRPLAKSVTRVGGTDRYDTSRKLVASAFTGPIDNLYLATGRNFPDALSVVPAAAHGNNPVLLIDGNARTLDGPTAALIKRLTPRQMTVVGGTAAVSESLRESANTLKWTWRKGGANRYETSAIIGATWHHVPHVYAASGEAFPDALTGGVLAGMKDQPLFLIQPACPAAAINSVASWMGPTGLTLLGGPTITINESARASSCPSVPRMGPQWDGHYAD